MIFCLRGTILNRKGFIALWLLAAFAALLSVLATLLYGAAQGVRDTAEYRNGLAAEYAAESGAVWALSYLRQNGFPEEKKEETVSIDDGTICLVTFHKETGGNYIDLAGEKTDTGSVRYLQLTVETDDTGVRVLTATNMRELF